MEPPSQGLREAFMEGRDADVGLLRGSRPTPLLSLAEPVNTEPVKGQH
ncbi:MAG: hypothetical protein ACXWXF_12295 [Aeromicrobium sp.]